MNLNKKNFALELKKFNSDINSFFDDNLLQQNLELREAHQRSLTVMEESRKFQSSTFDTVARRKLVEDQNTVLELSGRVRELLNEVTFKRDSEEFQDAESIRSGNSHVTSQPVFLEECQAEPQGRTAKHLGHTWYIGKRFCNYRCVIISTLSSRTVSMKFAHRGAASFIQWRKVKGKIKIWI